MKFLFFVLLIPSVCFSQDIFEPMIKQILLSSIIPDIGNSPTTIQMTIQPNNNAVIFETGYGVVTKPNFKVYFNDNGTQYTIDAYRLTRTMVKVRAGDVIKIGCDTAFPFTVRQYHDNLNRTAQTGFSGICSTDKIAPMNWAPTSSHITLADYNDAFTITHTGTRTPIFIREFDGTNWTLITSYILETNRDLTIWCVNKNIAIGTYTGASFTITGALYTVLNSHTTDARFIMPAYTGTQRTVTAGSYASFLTVCAAAVAGDQIVIPDGIYTMTSNPAFTANARAGHTSGAGLQFVSQSGNRNNCIFASGASAIFIFANNADTATDYFENITIRSEGNANPFDFTSGNLKCLGCKWAGVYESGSGGIGELVNVAMDASKDAVNTYFVDCETDSSYADEWDFNATTGVRFTNVANCSNIMVNCTGNFAGNFFNSQIITSHFGLSITVSGGTFNDAYEDEIGVQYTNGSFCYSEFLTITPGTRVGENQGAVFFGCNLTLTTSSAMQTYSVGSFAVGNYFNYINYAATAAFSTLIRNGNFTNFNHNIFNYTSGSRARAIFYNAQKGTPSSVGNIFSGAWPYVLITNGSTIGATTIITFTGNTIYGSAVGISIEDIYSKLILGDNALAANSTYLTIGRGGYYISKGYNIMGSYSGSETWKPATGEITTSSAEISSTTFIPIANGNADAGQGDNSQYNYIGSRDPFMLRWIGSNSRTPIGARGSLSYNSSDIILIDAN